MTLPAGSALGSILEGWGNFYLITGTAAAALTGLQFVVQTLMTSEAYGDVDGAEWEVGVGAFGTPTVVHFSLSLVLSAVLSVPWPDHGSLRLTLGALGLGALVYSGVVLRRALRMKTYAPVFEDWLWHVAFPAIAYAALVASAVLLAPGAEWPLFAVATVTLALLCIGIHNAWDAISYLTVTAARTALEASRRATGRPDTPDGTAGPDGER